MTERDWDKELAKIDRHLQQAPEPAAPTPVVGGRAAQVAQADAAVAPPRRTSAVAVYARVLLAILLAVGIVYWPYVARCGPALIGYLAAVGVVVLGGLWASVWTWRHRAAVAHTMSLLVILWGLVLAALEVLPRVGYAKPTMEHPTSWMCS